LNSVCTYAAALLDEEEEQNELAGSIRADAIQWREDASMVDICETFIEFATRTGFVTADGDIA
jgi:methyl coenzyme M reductase gamma subunit